MDKNNLVAWLPFDTSPTADKCGNSWTAYGSPTISETNAISGKALQLNGSSYLSKSGGITLGGQDFTVCGRFNLTSSSGSYCRIFSFHNANSTTANCINLARNGASSDFFTDCMNSSSSNFAVALNENHYFAYVYQHDEGKVKIFIDGELKLDWSKTIARTNFPNVFIGKSNWNDGYPAGTIDEFQIYDGVALYTENFTPPTADDYIQLAMDMDGYAPISLDFDVERVVQNDAYIKPIAQSLKVWLPFDTSTTADKCGNTWTAYGSPTLGTANAINGNALQLSGGSYVMCTDVTIGEKDFTICGWCYVNSSSGNWARVFEMLTTDANSANILYLAKNGSNFVLSARGASDRETQKSFTGTFNQRIHFAVVYQHEAATVKCYINGQLSATITNKTMARVSRRLRLGKSSWSGDGTFVGTIDEFQIYDGVALYTENFTPPTADDYIQLAMDMDGYAPISLDFDVERKVRNAAKTWRYVNAGTADTLTISGTTLTDLPESKSITGTAFYQTQRVKCFDIPATAEIWIKFDVYFDGSNRWRVYNGGNNGTTGITAQTTGALDFWVNDSDKGIVDSICKTNQLQTVLLHMVSGSSAGVVEAWVDGTKIYRYTGDANHGEDFADLYLQSDGAGTFFSNVIISNAEIELGEGWQIFTFDTERQVAKAFDIDFDVERQVQNSMPFQIDFDVEIKDILPVTIAADTERKIIVLVDLSADLELLSIVLVDFTADLARNIKANINLYKTDNSQYFSGGSSAPIVIPTQEVVPPATDSEAVTQSIEITIAEQQITDQVTVVTAIPLDIMYPVQGQYLDYCCDMRVERVSKQGILYTADCCSDLDALLYTQLAYKLPTTSTWQKVGKDNTTQEITTYYPPATAHVASVAKALGLTPVMQFDNFLSTLLFDDLGGLTYADIIRDVFGWSSRVPTHLINCYIRNGILYVIQRGHEANVIDISGADMTLPIFTHELVRTTWGSSPNSATETREQVTRNFVPADSIAGGGTSGGDDSGGDGDSGGDSEKEKSWLNVGSVTVSDSSGTTTTTYSYDSNGILRETVAVFTSRIDSKESSTTTTTNSYNSDKLLSKTEVDVSHPYNHDADTLTITTYGYKTLANNQKFLSTEMVTMYENGKWVDTRVTTKSPTGRGQGATTDNSGNTDTGGNISDDRATPYSEKKAAELIKSLPENATDSDGQFVDGVSLYDSSFPVHDTATLIKLTNALKWLNRKTRETVNLSIYNFPHLIDFNDRIVLFGETYFLASNRAHTNPRIYNEQALTLVRWY